MDNNRDIFIPLDLLSFFSEKNPYGWTLTFFVLKFTARSAHTDKQDRSCCCNLNRNFQRRNLNL